MRGEETTNTGQKSKTYFYHYCEYCKVKLHVEAISCWKCGVRPKSTIYYSTDPEDALYNTPMNCVEVCMKCYTVLNLGIVCAPIICFGTGRGKCDACNRFESIRFECCQKEQQRESPDDVFGNLTKNKKPGPLAETLAKVCSDEIPF